MKRRLVWSVGIAVFLFATATWVSAATMGGVVGDWVVYSKAKGKVSKLGSDHSEGPARITFEAPQGSNTGTFTYHDPGGYIYTGEFTLTADGKSLTMEFDPAGLNEFESMMAHWLQIGATEKNLHLENIQAAPVAIQGRVVYRSLIVRSLPAFNVMLACIIDSSYF